MTCLLPRFASVPLRFATPATKERNARHAAGQFFRDAKIGSRRRHDTARCHPVGSKGHGGDVCIHRPAVFRSNKSLSLRRFFFGKSMLALVPLYRPFFRLLLPFSPETSFILPVFLELTTCLQKDSHGRRCHSYNVSVVILRHLHLCYRYAITREFLGIARNIKSRSKIRSKCLDKKVATDAFDRCYKISKMKLV